MDIHVLSCGNQIIIQNHTQFVKYKLVKVNSTANTSQEGIKPLRTNIWIICLQVIIHMGYQITARKIKYAMVS